MLRLHGVEQSDPFDGFMKRLFFSGEMAERKLEVALHAEFNEIQSQVHLENECFIGTADFIIPSLAIVEHKETGKNNFKYKSLPMENHCLQVLAYQRLLGEPGTDAIIYYQNQADWAEFRVWEHWDSIVWEGEINGTYKTGEIETTLDAEMQALIKPYRKDEIPPRYKTPFEKNYTCCSMYKTYAYSRCNWFNYCWEGTEYEGQNKLRLPEGK